MVNQRVYHWIVLLCDFTGGMYILIHIFVMHKLLQSIILTNKITGICKNKIDNLTGFILICHDHYKKFDFIDKYKSNNFTAIPINLLLNCDCKF